MIFRRIKAHVESENWFAVAIDFCIVVIGVFIGLQVANWNAARGDHAAEVRYLEALLSDVSASITHLEDRLADMEAQQVFRQKLYAYSRVPDGTPLPEDIDDLLQGGLFFIVRVDVSQNAFETLTNSGQISLIQDPNLVSALQELDTAIEGANGWQEEILLFTYDFSDHFMIEETNMEPVSQVAALGVGNLIEWIEDGEHPETLSPALRSRQFRNMLIYQAAISSGRIISTKALLDQYRDAKALIENRQSILGLAP